MVFIPCNSIPDLLAQYPVEPGGWAKVQRERLHGAQVTTCVSPFTLVLEVAKDDNV